MASEPYAPTSDKAQQRFGLTETNSAARRGSQNDVNRRMARGVHRQRLILLS